MTETQPERRLILPADYYSSESPRAILPPWATFGCGGLAVLALLVLFAGGAWLSGGGMVDLFDMVLGMTRAELRPLYARDVPAADRAALEKEIDTLRDQLRKGRVSPQRLSPLLQSMQRAIADRTVTPQETAEIAGAAKKINAAATAPPAASGEQSP